LHKTKTASDQNKYKDASRNARRVALAHEKTRQVQQERRMSTGLQSKWQNAGRM